MLLFYKYKKIFIFINMILNVPYDVKWNIAHFIDDIDMRRFFNIYGKIDLEKYKILNQTIRKNGREYGVFTRYNFQENCENTISRYYNVDGFATVCHDTMDVNIIVYDEYILYKIYLFKLKKKPYQDYENKNDIYYKGILQCSHYWQSLVIEYITS
tara:strand:- start:106 stop:573 length:468 start_codon:yes stop_codon:yes gene_type:complete